METGKWFSSMREREREALMPLKSRTEPLEDEVN